MSDEQIQQRNKIMNMDNMDIPIDIIQAAQKVENWMKNNGYTQWALMGLCSRNYVDETRSTFQHMLLHNPTAYSVAQAGGNAQYCAVALAAENSRLIDRLIKLKSITPRQIKLPDDVC